MRDESLVAVRLRECRLGMGWTEEDVAQAIGVSRSTVSNWEATSSRQRIPPLDTLKRLALWYGVSSDWLVGMPLAEKENAGIRAGRAAVRQSFVTEVRRLSVPTPSARMAAAIAILQETAPEAWFTPRIAANLLVTPERLQLMLSDQADVPDALLERLARLVEVPLAWFYVRVNDIGENEQTG